MNMQSKMLSLELLLSMLEQSGPLFRGSQALFNILCVCVCVCVCECLCVSVCVLVCRCQCLLFRGSQVLLDVVCLCLCVSVCMCVCVCVCGGGRCIVCACVWLASTV